LGFHVNLLERIQSLEKHSCSQWCS